MNIQELAASFGLDLEETIDIIHVFIGSAATDLNTIRQAVDGEDAENIRSAAHSLKGAAGNLGFMEMSDMARKIENEAGARQFHAIRQSLDALFRQLEQIKAQMDEIG